ncbi:MAG: hypothetical protein JKX69_03190 [Rhodobacteraceae bacterium]|nr:hypothetical protein [Paracoccaceae bacterium]
MQGRDCALTYPQSCAHEGALLVSVVECSWEYPLSIEAKSPRPTAHTQPHKTRNKSQITSTPKTSAISRSELGLGVNGINIGLFCSTPMIALTRAIGRKAAFEMLSTGRLIEASEAKSLGLINRIASTETLETETNKLAQTVAAKLGSAMRAGKQAFYAQATLPLDAAYALTAEVMTKNMLNPDTDEGITAFLEKRPPGWA